MPDRRTHREVGARIGAGAALFHARLENGVQKWVEVLGGAAGGIWGGELPDVLEPAVTPRHRDLAHSVVALAGVVSLRLEAGRLHCRAQAAACARQWLNPDLDALSHFLLFLEEILWRFVAGTLGGLQGGYIATPMGLPLLCR